PNGMPRPSSITLTEPSACTVTSMRLPWPASASSAAVAITSWMMFSGLSVRVYMPGRCLTGSRPLRTRIDASPYSPADLLWGLVAMGANSRRRLGVGLHAIDQGLHAELEGPVPLGRLEETRRGHEARAFAHDEFVAHRFG